MHRQISSHGTNTQSSTPPPQAHRGDQHQVKVPAMPSAAALRAQQEHSAEVAPSNPFAGADEGLLLATALDVVANVASKATLFDAGRDEIFPRFDEEGETWMI